MLALYSLTSCDLRSKEMFVLSCLHPGGRVLWSTDTPSRCRLGRSPTPGWTKSRLRGCTGLRVTGGVVTTMRTCVLSWGVSSGRKRGRNEVSSSVVVGFSYWNIREHPLPVDGHGDLEGGSVGWRAGAGASDCGVAAVGPPRPFQGESSCTIWRAYGAIRFFNIIAEMKVSSLSIYSLYSITSYLLLYIFKTSFYVGVDQAVISARHPAQYGVHVAKP